MAEQSYSMHSGDTKTIYARMFDDAGDAIDVSTAGTVTYKIAASVSGSVSVTKTLDDGVSVAYNKVTITLGTADTASLSGDYYHELESITSTYRQTPFYGTVTIDADLIT